MDESTSVMLTPEQPTFPFDGEPRDIDGVLSIGWEVRDDYGNLVHREAWLNSRPWVDKTLAPIDNIEALRSKAEAARSAAIAKIRKLVIAQAPPVPEESCLEGFIPVPEKVTRLWDELDLVLTEKGAPVPNMDNVVRVIEGLEGFRGRIWLDEFTRTVNTTFSCRPGEVEREWTDDDSRQLWLELQRRISICRVGKETVHEAVMAYAHFNRRHPVKDWLAQTEWDHVPRLDTFFREYFGAEDTKFNAAASANFFVSMLARVYDPGCKVDNMVVLEGNQGRFKSSALKALCGKWFTECNEPISNGSNKDFYAILQGKMLVEIAELDSFSRADILRIKAIITTATDRYRPAYGRIAQNFPRTSVFVGTTNEEEYLADSTGGRRFWPVRTGVIRLGEIERDRAQLFAEALIRYRTIKAWWKMPDEEALMIQESRRKGDMWEESIEAWLTLPRMIQEVTSHQIAGECLKMDLERVDQRTGNRIAHCMKALGYKNKYQWDASIKKCVRVWSKSMPTGAV